MARGEGENPSNDRSFPFSENLRKEQAIKNIRNRERKISMHAKVLRNVLCSISDTKHNKPSVSWAASTLAVAARKHHFLFILVFPSIILAYRQGSLPKWL